MIAATTASTFAAVSRLAASNPAKAAAKPGAAASSLSGKRRLAETLEPLTDLVGPGLERRPIDDETRGDVGDALDLDQPVGLQRRAGLHKVDDVAREAEAGRQLHGAVELDAFGLDAA